MRSRLSLWWEARTSDPELSDDALVGSTRQVTKAIVQTVNNRANRRPELAIGEPFDTARRQQAFDRETVETYRDNIAPELTSLRSEYVARGLWTTTMDHLATEPQDVGDLRELVIELESLATHLEA